MKTFLTAILLAGAWTRALAAEPEAVKITVVRPHTYIVKGSFHSLASRPLAWRVLTDYAKIPLYSPSLKTSTVVSRLKNSVRLRQEGDTGFLFFKRHFVMDMAITENLPHRLDFEEVSHQDFVEYRGSWRVDEIPGGCEVAYTLEAVADFGPLINWAAKDFIRKTSKESLGLLKREMDRQSDLPAPAAQKKVPPSTGSRQAPPAPRASHPIPRPTATPGQASLHLEDGSSLELEGTSTLHAYTCKAGGLSLTALARAVTGKTLAGLIRGHEVSSFLLAIPVKKLKSGEGGLDSNLLKAMQEDQFPWITFRMKTYRMAGEGKVEAEGTLNIHGTGREVLLPAELTGVSGNARLTGSYGLNMKDYGVVPPRLFLGALTVGDEVTIRYDLRLALP